MSFDDPARLHDVFAQALQAGDVDALLDLYEPGAVVALPDGGRVSGREALGAMFTGIIESGQTSGGEQRETIVADDVALTSTAYRSEVAGPDGTTRHVDITTAEVSRRGPDGTWRVVIDAPTFSDRSG